MSSNPIQDGRSFYLTWNFPTPERVEVRRDLNQISTVLATELPASTTYYVDIIPGLTEGTAIQYTVIGLDSAGVEILTIVAGAADVPFTYGIVDPLVSTIRYADLDTVKRRLGITTGDYDLELTQAIISAETSMDLFWQRSFPDTGTNPQYAGVPAQVRQAAENVAVAYFKQTDAPFGVAGSDEFMGAMDIDDMARREIMRSPLLKGFRVAFGVA